MLFFDQVLERPALQRPVRIHPFQLPVFFLTFPQPLDVRSRHPAVFRIPVAIRRLRDRVLPSNFHQLPSVLDLFQDRKNLILTESAPFHSQPPELSF